MNIEEIKPNATYSVRVKVQTLNEDGICVVRILDAVYGTQYHDVVITSRNLHPIPSPPKYDPCRKLKVGDVVRVLKINGNLPKCKRGGNIPKEGVTGIVRDLRKDDHFVWVDCKEIVCYCIDPAYLELVTPVEELEPYFIEETEYEYCVSIMVGERKDTPAIYHKRMHPHAKAAAEAERDRLNAEHRKEQK